MDSNHELDLEQWLPALAALPCCHSLGLIYSGNLVHAGDDDAFDAIAVRSGLATSLELRLLTSNYKALPALAAERAGRGLPCVAMGSEHEWLAEMPPRARLGQCELLPSPQIDTGPSVETKLCQPYAAAMAARPSM